MVWAEEGGITVEPYDWVMKKKSKEVIMKRLRMRARVYEEVDWEMHGAALRQIPQVLRGVWDEIPTQVKTKRNGYSKDDKCKLCGETDGCEHYAGCRHAGLVERRRMLIGNLRSGMECLKANSFLTYWILEAVWGDYPILERVTLLRLEQKVKAACDSQNLIVWLHLAKGRATENLVAIQEWWDMENLYLKMRHRDARTVVVKVLGLAVLVRYDMWKVRCEVVADLVLPAKKQIQWDIVGQLKERQHEVESRDKCLFEEEHVPKTSDSLQRMEDWVLAVTMSIKRAKETCLVGLTKMG